ncbi:MAG: bifunctional riboflavin kinase/FAD synthetase [Rhodobacteraceae bacterium]|jgi:riboflavin kinase/FMN adenylyltransferase|uniref:bifunctional riboflavin kinase/FAD synthetase n=1 Tax=Albidovulum sp. TaxID=1872424 RepID=UPI001DB334E6|nr:bifunctional riboflavin kinase/FAD synthetase [uncultured Defluviimonas sp.]MCB2125904.1 bifunctional riboflavin kinase/FAD synthetase [Paracoccaceae bacterium]MCC0069742.1 bifunctional riboflavin kinase/FAD synthetase [Paracoccaceae bacterium]
MHIHHHWTGIAPAHRGASVALGNFDGVHLGHQRVIALAAEAAASLGIVTFEPHPREFFAPAAPAFRLMNAEARVHRLEKLGVAELYELPFDAALAGMEAEAFVAEVLVAGLGVCHVTVGADFCFGKGRKGTTETLRREGARLGFGVTIADLVAAEGAEISSTAIRRALSEGRPRDAARMLGHWHRIDGPVLDGDKRGRDLGYPTANMALDGLHLPKLGVYAVKVDVLTGPHAGSYDGAASLGIRPMFEVPHPTLETHLLDFSGHLYGEHLSVALVDYLRPEIKFDGLPALVAQMGADCAQARGILAAL